MFNKAMQGELCKQFICKKRLMKWISYFSQQGSQQALFLRHEGYLGAIGAFLASAGNISLPIIGGFK